MQILDTFSFYLLLLIGFAAGFLDSIVGGGGLIATPGMLNLFPNWNILQVIGTNRTSSILGTSVAAMNYFRNLKPEKHLLIPACLGALTASYFGVQLAKKMPPDILKLTVLVAAVLVAFYTFFKKELGKHEKRHFAAQKEPFVALGIGVCCGFYNGLIGPGTGTLLVFAFVSLVGLDFLQSSGISKAVNVSGDISSWLVLFTGGYIIWAAAVPLVLSNVVGSYFGSRLAILKGSKFIKWMFFVVVICLIARQIFLLN